MVFSSIATILAFNIFIFLLKKFFFCLFRAVPTTYGSSLARSQVGAAASGLCHSHSNMGPEPCLQPTPQLMEMPDP